MTGAVRSGTATAKPTKSPPRLKKASNKPNENYSAFRCGVLRSPHRVIGRYGASQIVLIPASEGTGVIAGAAPRSVLELAGVKDVLTKSYGSNAAKNLVKATLDGLKQLRTRAQIEELRGVKLDLPPEPEPETEAVEAYVDARPDHEADDVADEDRR